MEIIKQHHEVIGVVPYSVHDNMRLIERVGRTCYQSFDKMTPDSYIPFVNDVLVKRGHLAMVEHSNMVVYIPSMSVFQSGEEHVRCLFDSNFLNIINVHVGEDLPAGMYIGGNYTAWMNLIGYMRVEELRQAVLEYIQANGVHKASITDTYPHDLKRVTVFFRTNRAMTHELVRHRPPSYGQLSQRYVRYSSIVFIQPVGLEDKPLFMKIFRASCEEAEQFYNGLRMLEYPPQVCRNVLTNAVATDIYITADIPEWKHIFNLRCAKSADPQMQDLMIPVRDEFIERKLI